VHLAGTDRLRPADEQRVRIEVTHSTSGTPAPARRYRWAARW
jgi:hypothetical protein